MNTFWVSLIFIATLLQISPVTAVLLQRGEVQFDIDPATLQISAGAVVVNNPQQAQKVREPQYSPSQANWRWPERSIQITARPDGPDLRLTMPHILNGFSIPSHFSMLQLPTGEGRRIPLDNARWLSCLTRELSGMDTNFALKLPLWGLEQKGKTDSWLLLSPFSNQVSFTKAGKQLMMQSSHEFNRFNQHQSFDVLLLAGTTMLSGAIRCREYLQQSGQFSSLRDKIATAPHRKEKSWRGIV